MRKDTVRMRDVELKENSKALLENGNGEEFHRRCGNEFIVGSTKGGEFYGVYQINSSSSDQLREIEAQVSASGALGSWSASGDFQQSIRKLSELYSMSFRTYIYGVASNVEKPTTADEMIDFAQKFPQYVEDAGREYLATCMNYETCDNYPIIEEPNQIDIERQKQVLESLADHRLRILNIIASIEYILYHSEQFEPFNSTSLTNEANKLRDAVNLIVAAASRCLNDWQECELLNNLPDPAAISLPKRMDSNVIGAIALAKEAAQRAQRHAQACDLHTRKIVEISRQIKIGSDGVTLANQAKTELSDAKTALMMTQQALVDARTTNAVTDEVLQWIELAEEAVRYANDDILIAEEHWNKCYKIGYAPYWKAPTVIYLGNYGPSGTKSQFSKDFKIDESFYQKYCEDPQSRNPIKILPGCDNPQRIDWGRGSGKLGCPIEDRYGSADMPGHHGITLKTLFGGEQWLKFGVSTEWMSHLYPSGHDSEFYNISNTEWDAAIILESQGTGLRTLVNLRLFCFDGIAKHDNYIDVNRNIVVSQIYSPEPLLDKKRDKFTSGKSIGWIGDSQS